MLRRIREVKDDQSGFTLIELLIVIVILGILAAVVVFAVGAFNKNGEQAACRADFKSVEIADEAFYAKNGGNYATVTGDLVPGYLDRMPTNTAYTILIGGVDPSTGNPGDKTLPASVKVGNGAATTDDSACGALTK